MDNQIDAKQPVICEFCGASVRYDRLIRHVQKAHDSKPLTKPVVVSDVTFSAKPKIKRRGGGKRPVKHLTGIPIDDIKKCPHGVPEIQKCAICDPEGWRIENGY